MATCALTVLISEPQGISGDLQFDNSKPYLPYVWAILKSYWERHGEAGTCEWLDPIWRNDDPGRLLEPYEERAIDVLGLSCYTWNWELQIEIARRVKLQHPSCVVVAGGPEPDYKDRAFFVEHPYIDAIAVKDGEITFMALLRKIAVADFDFRDICGLYLPGGDYHICTGAPLLPTRFDHSPYIDQSAYYERLVSKFEPGTFDAIVETNRGCPYGCSFCDWGSNTASKIRRFDMERVETELAWLGRAGIGRLMLADANFGILPRDVDIAEMINGVRDAHDGYPKNIFWSAAKNHPERVIAIAKCFAESGVCTAHALSIQHTKKEVLAATARSNISPERQVQVVKAMMAAQVPIEVQLILGIPGDTYELWKGCLADLMEWGIHEDYLIQAYRLLPNAPAAEPEFLDRWAVETVARVMHDHTVRDLSAPRNLLQKAEKVVISSATYSINDWVKMSVFSAFIKALHNASLTQRIAAYLRLTHGVPYLDFYEGLIEDGLGRSALTDGWLAAVSQHYQSFLVETDASDHMAIDALPSLPFAVHPSRWIFIHACLHLDAFYDVVHDHLIDRYPQVPSVSGVVNFQRDVMLLPSYDRDRGARFTVDADWISYFRVARAREGAEPLEEPSPTPGVVVYATDRSSGERLNALGVDTGGYFGKALDWNRFEGEARWVRWIEQVVVGRSSAGLHTFQDLRLEPLKIARGKARDDD